MISKQYNFTDTAFDVVNAGLLRSEIEKNNLITIGISEINVSQINQNFTVNFKAALSTSEETVLDSVVAAHNGFLKQGEESTEVTVNLADGESKVSSNDQSTAFLFEKLVAENSKIKIIVLNEGGSEQLEIGVVPANIGTSELNNDASFINASQAPVQASDIADFETSTELDGRDVNNRNRANHTGNQPASTISDFQSAVQNAETVTTLSFNPANSQLTFTSENGLAQVLDLSSLLDNTNLAQIVSGTLDANTGIVTFTRDDNSTFSVDFSSLNDQAAINTAISTHEQTIANHNDVDLSGIQVGQILQWNGLNFVPVNNTSNDYKVEIQDDTPAGTQLTSFQQRKRLNFNIPEAGRYKLTVGYNWSVNTTNTDFTSRVQLNDTSNIWVQNHRQEPRDSGGAGVTVQRIEGGTFNSGTDQCHGWGRSRVLTLPTGAGFIDLDMACSAAGNEATIYDVDMILERFD